MWVERSVDGLWALIWACCLSPANAEADMKAAKEKEADPKDAKKSEAKVPWPHPIPFMYTGLKGHMH